MHLLSLFFIFPNFLKIFLSFDDYILLFLNEIVKNRILMFMLLKLSRVINKNVYNKQGDYNQLPNILKALMQYREFRS